MNKKQKPIIDVVISNHNYGDYLRDCIESFQSQLLDRSKYRVVVVDDGSTDNSLVVLDRLKQDGYLDKYYQVDFNNPNKTRNYGAMKTDSEYILFFDSDDFAHNKLLMKLLEAIRKNESDVVVCDAQKTSRTTAIATKLTRENIVRQSGIHLGSVLVTRDIWNDVGGFSEDVECLDDYDLWMKMSNSKAKFTKVPGKYFFHRDNKDNSRSKTVNKDQEKRQQAYADIHKKYCSVTVFTPFNGKHYCVDMFLDNLDKMEGYDKLMLFDNSNEERFHNILGEFAQDRDDAKIYVDDTPHLTVPFDRTTTKQRIEIGKRTTEIYNFMARNIDTDYVLILEDDVIPPVNVINRLMDRVFCNVGMVSSAVNDRRMGEFMVWDFKEHLADGNQIKENVVDVKAMRPNKGGIEKVGATSLACSLIPKWALDEIGTLRYDVPGGVRYGTDVRFGYDLHKHGLSVIVDWDIIPAHVSP